MSFTTFLLALPAIPSAGYAPICIRVHGTYRTRPILNHLSDRLLKCVVFMHSIEGLLIYKNNSNLSSVSELSILLQCVAFCTSILPTCYK